MNVTTVDRAAILDLAAKARRRHNQPLCDLLWTVAGMLRRDGTVDAEPDGGTPWGEVNAPGGPFGVGLRLAADRRLATTRGHDLTDPDEYQWEGK